MGDAASAALGTAAANAVAKRQSDFVGDLLLALHGDEEIRLSWQEAREFLSAGRLSRWGNLWQAWSSETADVCSAMAERSALLDREAEVLLHVNSAKEFDAGVRINMAVQVERGCCLV